MTNENENKGINLTDEISKFLANSFQSSDIKEKIKELPKQYLNNDEDSVFEEKILIGCTNLEKEEYLKQIKPSIVLFSDNLKTKGILKTANFFDKSIGSGKSSIKLEQIPKDFQDFLSQLQILISRQVLIVNFMPLLEKGSSALSIDQKMYILLNSYRSITELVSKLLFDVCISIAKKIKLDSEDERSKIIQQIKEDRMTLGDLIEFLKKFEDSISQEENRISGVISNFIDVELRNSIAHERYSTEINVYFNSTKPIKYDDKEIITKILLVNRIFAALHHYLYEREFIALAKKYSSLFFK